MNFIKEIILVKRGVFLDQIVLFRINRMFDHLRHIRSFHVASHEWVSFDNLGIPKNQQTGNAAMKHGGKSPFKVHSGPIVIIISFDLEGPF